MVETKEAPVERTIAEKRARNHRRYLRFCEKFSAMDLTVDVGLDDTGWFFRNEETRRAYECFSIGWESHPAFNMRNVSVVGEVTETGVKFAAEPRLHTNTSRATKEADRLAKAHDKKFAVFTCIKAPEVIAGIAFKQYEGLKQKREAARQQKEQS